MEKQEFNMGKGVLFAFGAAVVAMAIWALIIAMFDIGSGGAIGGVFAAAVGMLVASAYRFGQGKPDIAGIVIAALLAALAAGGAIIFGVAGYLANNDLVSGLFAGISGTFELAGLSSEFARELYLSLAITTVVAAVIAAGTVKGVTAKKKDEEPPTPPQNPQA